jgi:glycerophosphoryl diester phosphodiesterase
VPRPLICAHRGASAYYPENSREAIIAAIELGAEMIETDIRRAPDGTLVLSHQPPESSEGLLTLAEFLELAGDRVVVDLELKESGYEAEIVAALDPRPARLVISSFDPACVAAIRELAPDVDAALLFGEQAVGADLFAQAEQCGATLMAPQFFLLTADVRSKARRAGTRLIVWTVNDAEMLDHVIAEPATWAVITDVPDVGLARRVAFEQRSAV